MSSQQEFESQAEGLTSARIQALTDGVFAIVITLMVFQIHVPDLAIGHEAELGGRLLSLYHEFIVYVMTFAVSGVFWIGHHFMFRFIRRTDRTLLWLSLVYLLFVAFIPFSAALVSRYPHQQVAVVWYGVHIALISLSNYAQFRYATWNYRLIEHNVDPKFLRAVGQRILLTPAACLLAIAFSFVNAAGSVAIYWLILVFYIFFPVRLDRRLQNHSPAEQR